MENKLDKLFRDKLENHSIQPPANAWGKSPLTPEGGMGTVTSEFDNSNVSVGVPPSGVRGSWGWRIAAAIALAGFIGWYVFDASTSKEQLPVAKETTTEKKSEEVKVDQNNAEEKKEVKKETVVPPKQKTFQEFKKPVQSVPLAKLEKKEEVIQEEHQPVETIASVEEVKETPVLVEPAVQPKQEKTLVIVYSLASVEPKQEVEPVKTKGIKKVIEFAKDVKGGETTLASVRDWKDNFFGADEKTRTEKQKSNN